MDYELMRRIDAPFEKEAFAKADSMQQPAYAWTWNAPTDRTEIVRQLNGMQRAGIRTMYILPEPEPFRNYTKRVHCTPDYLSEEFIAQVRFAAEYALSLGMTVWLYDEGGWPSGMACGQVRAAHPELGRKNFTLEKRHLEAGEKYVPADQALAAFADGKRIEPGVSFDNQTDIDEYVVTMFEGMNVDSLDPDNGKVFVESTHEKYTGQMRDLFGTIGADGKRIDGSGRIQLTFTDEPGTGPRAWPRGFAKTFMERFGYDLRDYLPQLMDVWADAKDADGIRARIDYRTLTGEMFRDNYLKPIHDWSRRNHVPSSGHLDIDHESTGPLYHHYGSVLQQLRETDIPGIDVIWGQITRPKGDELPCKEGNGFFPRFPSSAAAQTGNRLALTESFAVYSAALSGEDARYVLNFQLVRGINIFNINSISYTSSGASPVLIRPSFVREMPGYAHLRPMNDYIARASYLMRLGSPGADTALYYPARDIFAGGSIMKEAVAAFDTLGRKLESLHVDFDIIDDEGILAAVCENGEMRLGLGRYKHVLVPDCRFMPTAVREKLNGIDCDVSPALQVGSESIIVRKRLLPDGDRIFMLFNQSGKTVTAPVAFDAVSVASLDPQNGRIVQADANTTVTLLSGEAAFFLCTDEGTIEAEKAAEERLCASACDFTLRRVRETWIDAGGEHDRNVNEAAKPCALGCWDTVLPKEFSGEAVYETTLTLDHVPAAGEKYVLDLGHVDFTADAAIDGKPIGAVWADPKKLLFDGEVFGGKQMVRLAITVANTLANQCNSLPLEEMFPADEIGPYQEKLRELEKDAPVGGLYGPVRLMRLG